MAWCTNREPGLGSIRAGHSAAGSTAIPTSSDLPAGPELSATEPVAARPGGQDRCLAQRTQGDDRPRRPGSDAGQSAVGFPAAAQVPEPIPAGKGPAVTGPDVSRLMDQYFADLNQRKKDALKEASENYKVGSDMNMTATWRNGLFLSTTQKDFYIHIGGEMQYDSNFYGNVGQVPGTVNALKGSANGANSGDPKGGIGRAGRFRLLPPAACYPGRRFLGNRRVHVPTQAGESPKRSAGPR